MTSGGGCLSCPGCLGDWMDTLGERSGGVLACWGAVEGPA